MASLLDGFFSLAQDLNKVHEGDTQRMADGPAGDLEDELTLEMSDAELISLKSKWEARWKKAEGELTKVRDENEKYWKGEHYMSDDSLKGPRPVADNLIFESVETFLPIATRARPEPVVESDGTPEGDALAKDVTKMLIYQADICFLKLRIQKVTRFWSLNRVGVLKLGWSDKKKDIDIKVINPRSMILDPDATIAENGEYMGEFLAEIRSDQASTLAERFPEKKEDIEKSVSGKMGTKVYYQEWWTNEYVFWTLDKTVLGKKKNPHWNYGSERETVDEFGAPKMVQENDYNHFLTPKTPYAFLSVFSLGKHPWDDTSLIEQNLANQDMVNKRLRQIDRNADSMNGGSIVSGDSFTKEQAAMVDQALRDGGAIWVPRGDVRSAYARETGKEMPGFIYNNLQDMRNELRNVFGVRGSSPQGVVSEETVRGKIITRGQDESRIGGISQYIEQFADYVFNWMVQLMSVYYDEEHVAVIVGDAKTTEMVKLDRSRFTHRLLVSVKEGSLIPKDALTRANRAVDLFAAGALDPISLFNELDFPNPTEYARRLVMWKTDPASLFGGQSPQPGAPPDGQQPPPEMAPTGPPPEMPQAPPGEGPLFPIPQ